MDVNVGDIVSNILRSPELRATLQDSVVRSLRTLPVSSVSVVSPTSSAINSLASSSTFPSSSVRNEIQMLFPSVRNRSSNTVRRSLGPDKSKRNKLFYKDVFLLQKKDAVCTLQGLLKSAAYETGFGKTDVQFSIEWNALEVKNHIKEIFPQLHGVLFEFVVPISRRLIKPTIDENTELNGMALKRIFYQKPIYIRPKENLLHDDNVEENNIFDYDDFFKDHSYDSENETGERNQENEIKVENEIAQSILTLEDIIRNLQINIINDVLTCFNVYRADIFNCAVRTLQRKTFNAWNKISVKFSDISGLSEGAVDAGGPTREMFRLLLKHLQTSSVFIPLGDKVTLSLDRSLLEKRHYYYAGQIIALSLVHGGPGPHFFSKLLFSILVEGTDVTPNDDEISDNLKQCFSQFRACESLKELQEYMDSEQIFNIAGCEIIKSLEEREDIIKYISKFYMVDRVRPSFEQFKEGLKTCNIYNLMVEHSHLFKSVLCCSEKKVTAQFLEDLFTCELSEIGSNKRTSENIILAFWRDFLLDCEADADVNVNLEEILIFATGADKAPPLGFSLTPKLCFLHNDFLYPRANTCALELSLPTIHNNYDEFKRYVIYGIKNACDFAFA